jgi:hypothetical protein
MRVCVYAGMWIELRVLDRVHVYYSEYVYEVHPCFACWHVCTCTCAYLLKLQHTHTHKHTHTHFHESYT